MKKQLIRFSKVKIFLSYCVLLMFSGQVFAQKGYSVSVDPENKNGKILAGIINQSLIKTDTSFKWFAPNQNAYTPDSIIVNSIKKAKTQQLQFVVFGGTWCEDTQFILPRFFKLQELAALPEDNVSLFGVYHNKKTLGNLAAAFNITNVPTIIIMKNGKEIGRVVEYGKTGKWDQELADIINSN